MLLDFLKVVRMVFWSGVVGPGTSFSLARSRFALGARTIALRAHCRATRSKARLVGKSMGALHYLGSSRDSAPRVDRLGKISVHFLSLS